MSINKPKISLCPGQLTVGMVSVSENGMICGHRMWKTKGNSCCVTDKRTVRRSAWLTWAHIEFVGRPGLFQHHSGSYPQVHPSPERKFKRIFQPRKPVSISGSSISLLSKHLASPCIVRGLKIGLTSNVAATDVSEQLRGSTLSAFWEKRGPFSRDFCDKPSLAPLTGSRIQGSANPGWTASSPLPGLADIWLGMEAPAYFLEIISLPFLFLLYSIYCT